jgi:hypothetical protein
MGHEFSAHGHHYAILLKTLKIVVSSIFWEYIHDIYIRVKFW